MSDGETLMAVDLGIRCGLAVYDDSGDLLRYRSTNFGSRRRLKNAVYNIVRDAGPPSYLVTEGSRDLAEIWEKVAKKQGTRTIRVAPETWRAELLDRSRRRSGDDAKEAADNLARRIIEKTGADRPTSLRHDAAEAIAVGWWGLQRVGWHPED